MGVLLLTMILTGCGAGVFRPSPGTIVSTSSTTVSLYPETTEDLNGPCLFDLRLPAGGGAAVGTLVVYERGDTQLFYDDASVQASADTLHLAMLFAHECDAATTGSFQADASKGPSRVLTAALSELAVSSGHIELSTGQLILFGYSAAGVLVATMTEILPSRILGAVEYIPGDLYINLDQVSISPANAQIPTLILDNALDTKSGTTRGMDYFLRGLPLKALWAYGVQHATDHCCSLSTRSLVLPWMAALAGVGGNTLMNPGAFPSSVYGLFTCIQNTTVDVFGQTNCVISAASLETSMLASSRYGWLPDMASGRAWLAWVLNPVTN
ncbi:MAG: hypothetical protein ACRYFU_01440 [Janthinobacterium lividum]